MTKENQKQTLIVGANRAVCGGGPNIYDRATQGKRCYEVFFGRKEPCIGCPLEQVFFHKKRYTFNWSPFADLPEFMISLTPVLDPKGNVVEVIEEVELAGKSQMTGLLEKGLKELSVHHRQSQAQNEAREELMEEEKTLLRLAAHQMQHPLGILRGYLELFLRDPSPDNEQVLQEELKSLSSLVQNLLGMANEEKDSRDLRRANLDIVSIIRNFLAKLCNTDSCKHRVRLIADEVIYAEIDRWRFQEMIQVILENAMKYSPQGSQIIITVTEKEELIYGEVYNEGRGIAPQNLNKIFEPFFRENQEIPGAGLGLSLVKKMIERRGGKIWAESSEGKWAKIKFCVPVKAPKN